MNPITISNAVNATIKDKIVKDPIQPKNPNESIVQAKPANILNNA